MKHTIYKTTNLINEKIYVGAHSTENLEDSYLGSGTGILRAIRHYGKEHFKKETLFIFDTTEEMFAKEAEIVNENFVADRSNYNMVVGGFGGGLDNKKGTERLRWLWDNDPEWAAKYREKKSKAQKASNVRSFAGKKHTDEAKKKMSLRSKERTGIKNGSFGTCWITKDCVNKKIKKEELQSYLDKGYIAGMYVPENQKHSSTAGRVWITNGTNNKLIMEAELSKYDGYIKGRTK